MLRRAWVLWAAVACGVMAGCSSGGGGNTGGEGAGGSTTTSSTSSSTSSSTTSSTTTPVCGDGLLDLGEECDDTNTDGGDGCSPKCDAEKGYHCQGEPSTCATKCGDGVVAGNEACDDGDTAAGDGCSPSCKVEDGYDCLPTEPNVCKTVCGDGIVAGDEGCDDGDTTNDDGCSADCVIDVGFDCTGEPSDCMTVCGDGIVAGDEVCDDANTTDGDGCSAACAPEDGFDCLPTEPSVCTAVCGDGSLVGDETCDDGNTDDNDGCSPLCAAEDGFQCAGAPSVCTTTCGDGVIAGDETCEDGGLADGDGCSATCSIEAGYVCGGVPSVCATLCGDGVVAGAETCDDNNKAGGDGCAATCSTELGYVCTGAPSVCATDCGDGLKAGAETCDDGNTTAADGCAADCTVETGYQCTGMPSVCKTVCGDGVTGGAEVCDDGNKASGDGCSATCTLETGFNCTGTPTVCTPICGDGLKVGAEGCDDGNTIDGDGCSASCLADPGWEIEANDTIATANDFAALAVSNKIKGHISPTTDKDVFEIVIPAGAIGTIKAETLDGPAGTTCVSNALDSFLTIYDDSGTGSLATDGDSGAGYCSLTTVTGLDAGSYYVEVRRSSGSAFDYTLQITVTLAICGNATVETGEQCDDGNTTSGDGCSSTCKMESTPEAEPNNACPMTGTPAVLSKPLLYAGSITPAGDTDYYAFQLNSYADVHVETFDSSGPGSCTSIDTEVEVFSPLCASLASDDQAGINSCSLLDLKHLAPGNYYVAVTPYYSSSTFNYTVLLSPVALCGNGVVEGSEQCDGGADCQTDCMLVPVCGDGAKSTGEECDDHNTTDGDGCSSQCKLELHPEAEPNNTCTAAAAPLPLTKTLLFSGGISPAGDADHFGFTLANYADVRVETFDSAGPGTCVSIDSEVEAFDSTCTSLGSDDDSGVNLCSLLDPTTTSQAFMRHLGPGTYYIAVTAHSTSATFNYGAAVTAVALCGDGVVEGSEQCDGTADCQSDCLFIPVCGDGIMVTSEECDDHNTTDGDNCSSTCSVEASAEVEPNDTTAQADAAVPPITGSSRLKGRLTTSSDKDLWKITVTTQSVVRFEAFNHTLVDCVGMSSMSLTVLDSTGATWKSDAVSSGIGVCPAIVTNLDPGTYYIRVSSSSAVPFYTLEVKFESDNGTETEANNTTATANPEAGTDFYVCADHQTAADKDVYAVTVPAGKSIRAEVLEVGTTATNYETCESNGMDSYLSLFNSSSSTSPIAFDDDNGRGFCSLIDGTGATPLQSGAHNLAAGTYYLEVRAASTATGASGQFNYCLAVTIR